MDFLEMDSPYATGSRQTPCAYLEDPDVQLMLRVQHGDGRAFAELEARYAPRVFGYFCRLLRDRGGAEDLTQDVFLRLFRARERYQPRARFATWIYHVTQNVARNALRSRGRACPGHVTTSESMKIDYAAPSERLERHETAGIVRAAVAELAGQQRAAVELHQLQGRTYAEVASELNMTPKAVKSLLYRARNKLRASLRRVVR